MFDGLGLVWFLVFFSWCFCWWWFGFRSEAGFFFHFQLVLLCIFWLILLRLSSETAPEESCTWSTEIETGIFRTLEMESLHWRYFNSLTTFLISSEFSSTPHLVYRSFLPSILEGGRVWLLPAFVSLSKLPSLEPPPLLKST